MADAQLTTQTRCEDGESASGGAQVRPLGDLRTHYWLALEMSQVLGLDLQAEIDAGRLTGPEWEQLVQRCRGCDWAGGCPAWMAQQRLEAQMGAPNLSADPAPQRCENAQVFDALRKDAPDLGESEP